MDYHLLVASLSLAAGPGTGRVLRRVCRSRFAGLPSVLLGCLPRMRRAWRAASLASHVRRRAAGHSGRAEYHAQASAAPAPGVAGRAGPDLRPLSFLLAEQNVGTFWAPLQFYLRHPASLFRRPRRPFLYGRANYALLHARPSQALAALYPLPDARRVCRRNHSTPLQRAPWPA